MSPIGLLHLTDLHQGMDGQKTLWPNVKEKFLEDLSRMHDKAGPWDLIVFTGDLTQGGSRAEFDALDATLNEILEHLASLGSTPSLLAVPGNHDLQRPRESVALDALAKWHSKPAIAKEFFNNRSVATRQIVNQAFAEYTRWWNRRAATARLELQHGELPGEFAATFQKDGLRLALVGLNSSFLHFRDGMWEKLDVDPHQFFGVNKDPIAWLKTHHAALLLTHHPPEWIYPLVRGRFRSEINPPERFVAHLFGHMHEAAARVVSEGAASPRRSFQGLSLFGLRETSDDRSGSRIERNHGYAALRLSVRGDKGEITIWPRRLQLLKGADYWRLVPDTHCYDLELNNEAAQFYFKPNQPIPTLPKSPSSPSSDPSALTNALRMPAPSRTSGTSRPPTAPPPLPKSPSSPSSDLSIPARPPTIPPTNILVSQPPPLPLTQVDTQLPSEFDSTQEGIDTDAFGRPNPKIWNLVLSAVRRRLLLVSAIVVLLGVAFGLVLFIINRGNVEPKDDFMTACEIVHNKALSCKDLYIPAAATLEQNFSATDDIEGQKLLQKKNLEDIGAYCKGFNEELKQQRLNLALVHSADRIRDALMPQGAQCARMPTCDIFMSCYMPLYKESKLVDMCVSFVYLITQCPEELSFAHVLIDAESGLIAAKENTYSKLKATSCTATDTRSQLPLIRSAEHNDEFRKELIKCGESTFKESVVNESAIKINCPALAGCALPLLQRELARPR